jgi:hypothetical protein
VFTARYGLGILSIIQGNLVRVNLNVHSYWCNVHVMYGKAVSDLSEISVDMWCDWPLCLISYQLTGRFILESANFLLLLQYQDGSYSIQTRELSPSCNSRPAVNCIRQRRILQTKDSAQLNHGVMNQSLPQTSRQTESWHSLVFRQTSAQRTAPNVQRCYYCFLRHSASCSAHSHTLAALSFFPSNRDDVRNGSCMGAKLAVWSLTLIPGYGKVADANEHTESTWVERQWHVVCGADSDDRASEWRIRSESTKQGKLLIRYLSFTSYNHNHYDYSLLTPAFCLTLPCINLL